MTGTKFGCGAAQCLSCAVIVDNPDGTSYTSPTCIVSAASFNGKAIRTVEGHAKNGELSALQKAFIEHFAFQCGYCTAGLPQRGPGSARAAGEDAGGARRSREDHRRGARRPSVPLHRLHQIPRGGARRDSRRSQTLSRRKPSDRGAGGDKRHEIRDASCSILAAVAALPMSMLGGYALPQTAPHTLASPGELCRDRRYRRAVGGDVHRARQGADPSALRQLPSGRRPPAPGRRGPAAPAAGLRAARTVIGLAAMRCSICHQQGEFRSRPHAGPPGMASRAA